MTFAAIPVSVIIPCFRCSETIGRAVASIAAQSAQAAEIILVDDCSNDGTLDELHRLQNQYPSGWIKIYTQQENSGPGTARNLGWATACQPYIAFLDADDAWHQDKLKIQYQTMLANSNAVLSGHFYCWSNTEQSAPNVLVKPVVSKVGTCLLLLKNRFCTSTVLLKRDIPFRFVDGKRYCEDYDLWLQIVAGGGKALLIHSPLAYRYKAIYGESGLSAQLWNMERGELEAYLHLHQTNRLTAPLLATVLIWSFCKFLLRLVTVWLRTLFNREKTD